MAVTILGNAPIVRDIPRYGEADNYSESFGFQWNRFDKTQFHPCSSERFWRTTGWAPEEMAGQNVLEVGSGAGRFSRVVLEETKANLYSVDYSSAVDANWRNNRAIAPDRFRLFQASIYEMPFPDHSFDKVFCMGVLQHTPDFEGSVCELIAKTKSGGEIVVDFYQIRGWWTKLSAKYLLRPFTRKMPNDKLLRLIEANVDWLLGGNLPHNTLIPEGVSR
jgi:ubiquinone/menaquinone biosynthesis C-methylase UbiE